MMRKPSCLISCAAIPARPAAARLLFLKKGNVAIVKDDTEIAKVAEPGTPKYPSKLPVTGRGADRGSDQQHRRSGRCAGSEVFLCGGTRLGEADERGISRGAADLK
jgi:hypothetical protein